MKNSSFLVLSFLVSGTAAADVCDWNKPGINPYQGSLKAAVTAYLDDELPPEAKAEILKKAADHKFDARVVITKYTITSENKEYEYSSEIEGMYSGKNGKKCKGVVDRSKWGDNDKQEALAYCSGSFCVIYPEVCRNVSIVRRYRIEHQPPFAIPPPIFTDFPPIAMVPPVVTPPGVSQPPVTFESPPPNEGPGVPWYPIYPPIFVGLPPPCMLCEVPCPPVILPPSPPPPVPVPEPSTWILVLAGVGFLIWRVRRKA